jgi:hypothetical protein
MDLNELESAVRRECSEPQWQWFSDKSKALSSSEQLLDYLAIVLAMARRKVGSQALDGRWSCDEGARVLLIAYAQRCEPSSASAIVETVYQQGDEYEREAILKGLPLLDKNAELVKLAEEACRTNIVTLFTAISQQNDYPNQHFDEGTFNQMVLKSLFLDINIAPIIGLAARVNPSLSRMCYDYLRERLAAERSVPVSIWLTIRFEWCAAAEQEFIRFLADQNEQHRYYVAMSLSQQSVPLGVQHTVQKAVENRLEIESNPSILALLNSLSD